MTVEEFLKLNEEGRYLALAGLSDDESHALRRALTAAGGTHAWECAAERLHQEVCKHVEKQRAHFAVPTSGEAAHQALLAERAKKGE